MSSGETPEAVLAAALGSDVFGATAQRVNIPAQLRTDALAALAVLVAARDEQDGAIRQVERDHIAVEQALEAQLAEAVVARDEAREQVKAASAILAQAEKIVPGIITTSGRLSLLGPSEREELQASRDIAVDALRWIVAFPRTLDSAVRERARAALVELHPDGLSREEPHTIERRNEWTATNLPTHALVVTDDPPLAAEAAPEREGET